MGILLALLALTSRAAAQSSPDGLSPESLPSPAPSDAAPEIEEPPRPEPPAELPTAAVPAAEPPRTGVVLVDEHRRAVIVDGAYRRVEAGALTVTCGKHLILQRDDLSLQDKSPRRQRAIKAALGKAQTVDVPCGESISIRHVKITVAGRAHGGLGQRTLFSDSVLGADLTASIGLHIGRVDLYVFDLQLFFGSTSGGLPVRQVRTGPSVDFEAFSRVRVGCGFSLGGTTVTRATKGTTLTAFSAGARLFASVDVWKGAGHTALYLLGQLSVDSAGTFAPPDSRQRVPSTSLWGPTVAVGGRF